jgi:NAD-dependent SIR2 family protein deacetylase
MILIILGTSVVYYSVERKTSSIINRTTGKSLFINTNPDLTETEIYYNNLIKDLFNEAVPLLNSDPDL